MPGIALIASVEPGRPVPDTEMPQIQAAFGCRPDYRWRTLVDADWVRIAAFGFDAYPVEAWVEGGFAFVFEGYCYGCAADQMRGSLMATARRLADGHGDSPGAWCLQHEGDYVGVVLEPARRRLWLFNDAMGRLPIYLRRNGARVGVSREVKGLHAWGAPAEIDGIGVAQALTFGYTLGRHTLAKDVERLPAGSVLRLDAASGVVELTRYHDFDIGTLREGNTDTLADAAGRAAELYREGCRKIASTFAGRTHLVSLSGGFDSRAVLAGMIRAGAEAAAFTFEDAGTDTRGKDVAVAALVARRFGVPWEAIERPGVSGEDIERLLWVKDGLNYSDMAFLFKLHERLARRHGHDVVHLTGDNGDRTLDPQGAPRRIRDDSDLLAFVVGRHARLPIEAAAAAARVSADALRASIAEALAAYPERQPDDRYRHFILAERLFNWNFQAEDRNRSQFWHVAPFGLLNYFQYALSVPDRLKRHWRFCEAFLRCVDSRTVVDDYANWGAPITSWKRHVKPLAKTAYELLPTRVRIAVRDATLYRGLEASDVFRDYFRDCTERAAVNGVPLDLDVYRTLAAAVNVNEFHNLLTTVGYAVLVAERLH